jgi:hypothetical protein
MQISKYHSRCPWSSKLTIATFGLLFAVAPVLASSSPQAAPINRLTADSMNVETPTPAASAPATVTQAVIAAAAEVSGIDPNTLVLLESEARSWPDGCLGLAEINETCTQALVLGWRVVITNGEQRWFYRTDGEADQVRLEATLPNSLADAILADTASRSGISLEQLTISEIVANVWPDGCLGLEVPGEYCTQALVDGWRLVITDGERTWAYRTDTQGLTIRYESILPRSVINAVYQAIFAEGEVLRPSRLAIIEEEQRTWPNGCLGVVEGGGRAGEDRCTQWLVEGWRVVVTDGQRLWTFHTDYNGEQVVLVAKGP